MDKSASESGRKSGRESGETMDQSPGHPPAGAPMISYAQNFEDILLTRVFRAQNSGFYVDIGAFDPEIGSVTKAFYDRGWRGINIEPGPIFAKLAAARPDDINLNLAISDHTGAVAFLDDADDPGQSRILPPDAISPATRLVACDTLTNILATHAPGRTPDFIKIDVEGAEAAIITSTDWRQIRPNLIIIEATDPWTNQLANQSWEPTLLGYGYQRAYFDGINVFYIPAEQPDLQRHFTLPVNVLDHFVMHHSGLTRLQHALEISQSRLAERTDSERQSRADHAILTAQAQQLRNEIARYADDIAKLQNDIAHYQAFQQKLVDHLEWPDAPPALRPFLPLARLLQRSGLAPQPAKNLPAREPIAANPPSSPARPRLKSLLRLAYRPFRPILRPLAWRLRWFLTGDIRHDLTRVTDHLNHLSNAITNLHRLTETIKQTTPTADPAQHDPLINLVETALVMLALDAERIAADHRTLADQNDQHRA